MVVLDTRKPILKVHMLTPLIAMPIFSLCNTNSILNDQEIPEIPRGIYKET